MSDARYRDPPGGRVHKVRLMTCLMSAFAFLFTLTLILWRPRGISEAVGAGCGAAIVLIARIVSFHDVIDIVRQTANVLLFLFGMMIVTGIVEQAGVFDHLAAHAARLSRGSGRLLLFNVFLLGAVIIALLSLDVTIIILTPIVFVLVTRLGIDPIPYLFACAFVANTASLFLPISNLTNILVYDLLHLSFAHFAAVMLLPNLAALAVNIGAFFVIFRDRIPRQFTMQAVGLETRQVGFAPAAWSLALILLALLLFGLLGLPLSIPALVGAAILALVSLTKRRVATHIAQRLRHLVPLSLRAGDVHSHPRDRARVARTPHGSADRDGLSEFARDRRWHRHRREHRQQYPDDRRDDQPPARHRDTGSGASRLRDADRHEHRPQYRDRRFPGDDALVGDYP